MYSQRFQAQAFYWYVIQVISSYYTEAFIDKSEKKLYNFGKGCEIQGIQTPLRDFYFYRFQITENYATRSPLLLFARYHLQCMVTTQSGRITSNQQELSVIFSNLSFLNLSQGQPQEIMAATVEGR